jgi:hypothetical protein
MLAMETFRIFKILSRTIGVGGRPSSKDAPVGHSANTKPDGMAIGRLPSNRRPFEAEHDQGDILRRDTIAAHFLRSVESR